MSTTPGVSFFEYIVIITVDIFFVVFLYPQHLSTSFSHLITLWVKFFHTFFDLWIIFLKPLQHMYLSAIILLFLLWII